MSASTIMTGTMKNLFKQDEDLYLERIKICNHCKLLKTHKIFGKICNSALYLNPKTNELSPEPKLGFKNGCGCVLGSKCRVIDEKCPLGKW